MQAEIIYEDKSIIVIKKPSGIATQSANISQKDCVSYLKDYLRKAGSVKGDVYLGVVHRLDQPVAGLLVFAKNQKAAANLSKQVQNDFMCKHYHAYVEGIMEADAETELINYIYKDSRRSMAVILDDKAKAPAGAKVQKAELYYTVERVDEARDYSVLKIRLVTGRFHQIRAQLSGILHPILGDTKYGAVKECPADIFAFDNSGARAIALCADELTFLHPDTGKRMFFSLENI